MSKYTVELRFLIESGFELFDFDYEFFDESYRKTFEQHFIDHFYFREIGQETPARFKHYLKNKFHETLPKYVMEMQVKALEYEPLENYRLTTDKTITTDGSSSSEGENSNTGTNSSTDSGTNTSSGTNSSSGNSKKLKSETPEGYVDDNSNGYVSEVDRDNFSESGSNSNRVETSGTSNTSTTDNTSYSSESTRTETEKEQTVRHGLTGITSYPAILQKHVQLQRSLYSIEERFFSECDDLFMMIY